MELYTHVLQKTGVLKTFTVAKIVKKKDIEDLKKLIKEIASDENEYKTLLEEELSKISNMHDKANPIPGIIYKTEDSDKRQTILALTKKISKALKKNNFSKKELAFLISAIITELELTQEDFVNLKNELEEETKDDYDNNDDNDEEYED
jgi:septal ring factor EnvC (AmiA/AmiB activator)